MKLRFAIFTITISLATLFFTTFAEEVAKEDSPPEDEIVKPLGPITEPPIKLVHVLNPGEREYLSPNLIGLQNIAMNFLPLSMNFVNIIDAFREIVNGVRYEILTNAVDTKQSNKDVICRLVILEKPWLRTEWGDKVRELDHSNCTSDEDNLTGMDPAERARMLNDKYPRNAVFNGGTRNDLSADEMAKLESQILPFSKGVNSATLSKSTSVATPSTPATTTTMATTTTSTQRPENVNPEDDEATTLPPELNESEKKWLNGLFSVGAVNFEAKRREQQAAASQQQQQEDVQQQQQLDEQDYVVEDTRQFEQQQQQDDYYQMQEQDKKANHATTRRPLAAPVNVDLEKARLRLEDSLKHIATGEGPTYNIDKVYSANEQTVSGTLLIIDADLKDDKDEKVRCQIVIWSRPWLKKEPIETDINCQDRPRIKQRHSRSVDYAEKKTHKKHNHHNLGKVEHLFNKFQTRYNRQYENSLERQMRLRIFRQNLRTIEELNRNEQGSAKYGITEFADMTTAEYKMRTGLWQRDSKADRPVAPIPDIELPKEFDWREKGAITKVKNQGNCGSCWAFSVTGNIEGLNAVKTGKLEEYSEQELLDCDTVDSACGGGLPDNAYKAIESIGGLELESDYPYDAHKESCHFNSSLVRVRVKSFVDLPKNETAMAQWLIANGPISIGINANAMQFYRGGVSHPWRPLCTHSNLDHGVLIVGYGVSDYPMFKKTLPYWIVKNSWGPKWGEQGYYRVYRGDNTCGVSEMASSAVLE